MSAISGPPLASRLYTSRTDWMDKQPVWILVAVPSASLWAWTCGKVHRDDPASDKLRVRIVSENPMEWIEVNAEKGAVLPMTSQALCEIKEVDGLVLLPEEICLLRSNSFLRLVSMNHRLHVLNDQLRLQQTQGIQKEPISRLIPEDFLDGLPKY